MLCTFYNTGACPLVIRTLCYVIREKALVIWRYLEVVAVLYYTPVTFQYFIILYNTETKC